MQKSASISNLAVALVKAQAEMPVAIFDATNPFLKNKYATLGQVISTSKPILAKWGLSISQFPASQFVNGTYMVGVTSTLIHESGEWIEETVYMPPESQKGTNAGQQAGITISYFRRYAWASILGMYAEADTDGDTHDALENAEANEIVSKVFKTPEPGKIWSLEQMEAVVQGSEGTITDYDTAKRILDLSTLPDLAPVKTVSSWFKHYMGSGGNDEQACAKDANAAYQAAKKSKTTGGK